MDLRMHKLKSITLDIWDNLGYLRGKLGINAILLAYVLLLLPLFSAKSQDDLTRIELMLWNVELSTLPTDELAQNLDDLLNDYGYTLDLTFELSGLNDKWVLDVTTPVNWRLYIPQEHAAPLQRLSPVLYSWHDNQNVFEVRDSYEAIASILLYGEGVCVDSLTSPLSQDAFFNANCALLDGAFDEAASLLEFEVVSPDVATITNLAWSYWQQGQTAQALSLIQASQEMFESQPYEASALLATQAQLYALAFDYDAAVNAVDEAINTYRRTAYVAYAPSHMAKLYTLRGQMVLLLYEWDAVLSDYNTALSIAPFYSPAYFHRGVLFYTMGPRERALEDFQRYLSLAPTGFWAGQATDYIQRIEAELQALNE